MRKFNKAKPILDTLPQQIMVHSQSQHSKLMKRLMLWNITFKYKMFPWYHIFIGKVSGTLISWGNTKFSAISKYTAIFCSILSFLTIIYKNKETIHNLLFEFYSKI